MKAEGFVACCWSAVTIAAIGAGTPGNARACSLAAAEWVEYAVDASDSDQTAPTGFTDVSASVSRRQETVCAGETCTTTSCGNAGFVAFAYTPPLDDQTPEDQLGYRIVWLEGPVPESMRARVGPIWPLPGQLSFSLDFDEAAAIDATVALVGVDRAGNESAHSAPVHLVYSGCTKTWTSDDCLAPELVEDGPFQPRQRALTSGCSAAPVLPSAGGVSVLALFVPSLALFRFCRHRKRTP
jgi:hypothetical protein